jgi:hypothetical protein
MCFYVTLPLIPTPNNTSTFGIADFGATSHFITTDAAPVTNIMSDSNNPINVGISNRIQLKLSHPCKLDVSDLPNTSSSQDWPHHP